MSPSRSARDRRFRNTSSPEAYLPCLDNARPADRPQKDCPYLVPAFPADRAATAASERWEAFVPAASDCPAGGKRSRHSHPAPTSAVDCCRQPPPHPKCGPAATTMEFDEAPWPPIQVRRTAAQIAAWKL